MTRNGIFIAIEGGDGSGKATQAELLRKYLSDNLKKKVLKLSFPRYGEESSYYVSQYLNGLYGATDEAPADLVSLAYALDRFAAKNEILAFLEQPNSIVVADRYVSSNLAHQGAKYYNKYERGAYYRRILNTEYDILGIPKPDKNIVLIVPTDTAQQNVDNKSARLYTNKKRDMHESDASHLEKAKSNYEELCQLYPNDFTPILCTNQDGKMRSSEEIQNDIIAIVKDIIDKNQANLLK
jgi:dTMP kinase